MAAYTTFSSEALIRYVAMFDRGAPAQCVPVSGGIENSNYFITLEKDGSATDYVLTIVEDFDFTETSFFSRLLSHLQHYGLPVAAPVSTLDGMSATIFCGKPAFLFPRLTGSHLDRVSTSHCEQLGAFIAQSHKALSELSVTRDNPYPVSWMSETLDRHAKRLSAENSALLFQLIEEYRQVESLDLPRGLIHGDLFQDNALFDTDGKLTGVIDFYHACHDILIQDLAIAINDWCIEDGGITSETLQTAILRGYESVRPLTDNEHEFLPTLRRTSAARFALTRLLSGDPPLKDPAAMLALARQIPRRVTPD